MTTTRAPGESAILLFDVVDVLARQNVGYAVVGALAASVHGAVRASMDADAVISVGMQEAEGIRRTLNDAGFRVELARGDFADPIPGMLRVTDEHGNRVDLLIGLRGMEPQVFSRAVDVSFEGRTLKFVGREDFIAMKAFAGGPVDLQDASRAIAAAGDSLDLELLRRLARKYGRDASQALERILPR